MCFLKTIITFSFCFFFSSLAFSSHSTPESRQANRLETKAVELIDNDQMAQGMDLMKQAVAINPTPMRHMNYGSILFGNGVADFKAGHKPEALEILYQAQDQLAQAIVGFNPRKEAVFIAQAYFLLGEINLNALSNPEKAKMYYHKSLSFYPNLGAKAALEKLQ
jgi:tetratricopeptide (TPR) repeat protein